MEWLVYRSREDINDEEELLTDFFSHHKRLNLEAKKKLIKKSRHTSQWILVMNIWQINQLNCNRIVSIICYV